MEQTSQLTQQEKEKYMAEAIAEAKIAESKGEVPIGAVIVYKGEVIARGHNIRETTKDATTHAELLAIQDACKKVDNWRLEECQLFVTLEPCPMCSGAIILGRLSEVYFGAMDPKAGTCGSLMNLLADDRFNHQPYLESGILEAECGELLTHFFKELRARNKKRKADGVE
ncbi:nucleoside deaminase [Vagococcus coleopterorum]|uniref:tRNA-specific adenosine deaminase n=1 Tax=Vagococcus coleopterorum TaxID=2714946 RepID=A0A6G8AMP4_9ENTE|nr:tRNA adenosine(34) deaminase TadA [Vagococcus coleopterorum]QIL46351.1 nucleoside deaminase [Vagococcus coleopterorum]